MGYFLSVLPRSKPAIRMNLQIHIVAIIKPVRVRRVLCSQSPPPIIPTPARSSGKARYPPQSRGIQVNKTPTLERSKAADRAPGRHERRVRLREPGRPERIEVVLLTARDHDGHRR